MAVDIVPPPTPPATAPDTSAAGTKLWEHPSPSSTAMCGFLSDISTKFNLSLPDYPALHAWSITHVPEFWGEVWAYTGIRASTEYTEVLPPDAPIFPRPEWFAGARLNFAENLLFPANRSLDEDSPALIAATETSRTTLSWVELRERVRIFRAALRARGVTVGDRVAGYVGNHAEAVVAMLATTALGAVWTGVSPDTGVTGVLERLRQIEPRVLVCDDGAYYNGRGHGVLGKVTEIVDGLPGVECVVVIPTGAGAEGDAAGIRGAVRLEAFLEGGEDEDLAFEQLPPDHPVYILYSSGTTGAPKCIVHGAIGTLIQHKKEHALHCGLRPGSRMLYFTTATWMMWHWLVSALAVGATVVCYDGSPFRSPGEEEGTSVPDDLAMPRLCQDLDVTHFGTSAKYLSVLEQRGVVPTASLPLNKLEAIYSTGSPLAPSTFAFVYKAFPARINLGSITGGTDIISLFGAPCPLLPVRAGEIQCLGLGMAVRAWDGDGADVSASGEAGDLVCVAPFPCQPVGFWGPDGTEKYQAAYFERFPGVWHHGDYVRFERWTGSTGGLVMLGRSDGVLKPAGVRFGSSEIYNLVLKGFGGEVADALCVGRRREGEGDETVVLFLRMEPGVECDEELVDRVKGLIRKELSARHVPGVVVACPDIPVTSNGKKVETAVKQILCGMEVKIGAAVANPECLEWYREFARTSA
ncbi:acetoacetate-CoA ligase [Trichodelitschia bisporula]|uniref:Acetoacetate-CoA ligase n=1 Tax=Trichodelitschia bisporula TaxID=703511 RepID=A0A6G1HL25_9PEZI|nr:acetoacetate-CoA ligase [Trichodelitschia bisporula]